jgi:serine/threonine-protein kinase HipA
MISCEVYLWGSKVGTLAYVSDGVASFNYDERFIGSGINLSPLKMPLKDIVFSFPDLPTESFHGLPGIFADSLPDKYGNAVIDSWCAKNGRDPQNFTPLERLCYVGKRGMGALEYVPSLGGGRKANDLLELEELTQFASSILAQRSSFALPSNPRQMDELFQVSSSAGGARAKALVAFNNETGEIRSGQVRQEKGFGYYLVKFDGVSHNKDKEGDDPIHHTLIEYVYYLLAKRANIDMHPCFIKEENGRFHFFAKRFDRTDDGEKIMMASLAGLTHSDFNVPGSYSYEQGAQVLRAIGASEDIEEYFRRMVFNVVFRNQDDHVKNISFLMDREGYWRLSPAYDLTFAYNPVGPYTSSHQMRINGKKDGIDLSDVTESGKSMGLSVAAIKRIVNEVVSVVPLWRLEAEKVGVPLGVIETIENQFVVLR